MSEEVKKGEDFEVYPFLRKNWKIVLIAIILIFAFYFRFYHVDYPVVGYHNWKETHYLTEARNFADDGFFTNGFFIPAWNYPMVGQATSGAHADSFPTISVVVSIMFNLFGESLMIARLTSIMFMLGALLFLYLFTKELTKREDVAFTAMALGAMCPLFIFFGRQVQLVNIALFFMLGAGYFYLRWLKKINVKNTILVAAFLVMAFLTKYDFFIIFLPILFTFPYKRVFKKEFIDKNKLVFLWAILLALLIPLWMWYTKTVAEKLEGKMFADALDFGAVFKDGWWSSIWVYIADSFTHLGFYYLLAGLVVILILLRGKIPKFLRAAIYTSPIWIIVASGYLKGHVFHQYPIMPFILIVIAYLFVFIGLQVQKITKIKFAGVLVILLLLFTLYAPSMEAKDRMFNTQFVGLDIAGEYIKDHSSEDEWVVFPSHQSYGVLWHADRMGHGSGWTTVDKLKEVEEENNVRWYLVYQWGIQSLIANEANAELYEYVQNNYELKQIAFIQQGDQTQPLYFLLEKGGSFDLNEVNNMTQGKTIQTRNYEYTFGVQAVSYVNV